MSAETTVKTEIEISKESFHDWRLALATLREKKGMEIVVLHLGDVLIKSTEKLGLQNDYVHLLWEKFLSGQHTVMNERAKTEAQRNYDAIGSGLREMEESGLRADAYIQEHNLENMIGRSHRFLGRLCDYKGEYNNAIEHYKKSISIYSNETAPLVRVNNIEIQGFLAYSLIKLGKTEEGLNLAQSTYEAFNESDDGLELKQADYYTWAVWTSGIPLRNIEALLEENKITDQNKDWALEWINQADALLVIPQGEYTWADKTFEYRKDEVNALRRKLAEV